MVAHKAEQHTYPSVLEEFVLLALIQTCEGKRHNKALKHLRTTYGWFIDRLVRAHTKMSHTKNQRAKVNMRIHNVFDGCAASIDLHGPPECFLELVYTKAEQVLGSPHRKKTAREIEQLLAFSHEPHSLDMPLRDGDTLTYLDLPTTNTTPRPDDALAKERDFASMVEAPRGRHHVSKIEQVVLIEHFQHDLPITEIAKRHEIKPDKARAHLSRALRKMRGAIKDGQISGM